jgi:hypothetical protein
MAPFLAGMWACDARASVQAPSPRAPKPLILDLADDGKQLKLLVRHPEIGLVCELWCYEGGPFHYGKGSRREDGSVVLTHTSGQMTATTTFTPSGDDRVWMDVRVEGPVEALKRVPYVGPCMQLWHSEAFKRREKLTDFAERCFLYTMRGPVGLLDTGRGLMKSFKADAPENNPPCTQWYVPMGAPHPGDVWAFGASGDRPVQGIVGVESRDGRWLAAIGCAETRTLGQGWHDCIHHVPQLQADFDERTGRIVHRTVLYVMPNDKRRLLQSFRDDCPAVTGRESLALTASEDGRLRLTPRPPGGSALDVGLDLAGGAQPRSRASAWEASPWGGFVRGGASWRMWAYPKGDAVDLCVSLAEGAGTARVDATLAGTGWAAAAAPEEVPALVRRSPDGAWTAALVWEQRESSAPTRGVPSAGDGKAGTRSVRGRLFLYQGSTAMLRDRWVQTKEEWEHARPYRMPVEAAAGRAQGEGVRFAPNAERRLAYGLTIVPPWADGGTLHANFPEHFEHGDVGYGILRHSNQRENPWQIAPDGRSASYEVESPELPGVMVRATAVSEGDRARLTLKITNGGTKQLPRIKPLLCFWYAKLAGFPAALTDNFPHTYVVMDGKPVALADIKTSNPEATAKVAYVRGCDQHDCDKFANSRGGLIDRDIDRALIAVTARDGKRKLLIAFTPGKSILSNAHIPCAHADPFYGDLDPGQSAETSGVLFFTELPLEDAVRALGEAGRAK